mgnify:CR=1 FL=1
MPSASIYLPFPLNKSFANEQLIKAHIEKLFTVGLNLAWALNCYQVARPVQPAVPGGGGDEAGGPARRRTLMRRPASSTNRSLAVFT